MNTNRSNFKLWYSDILNYLYLRENTGFVILMITFPLLERYLREKSGVYEAKLDNRFYQELINIFPNVLTMDLAAQFWQAYRNGLLHQVTISLKERQDIGLRLAGLKNDIDILSVDYTGKLWINPVKFAKRVIEVIEADFTTFEGQNSINHPLPIVHHVSSTLLGTSADFKMPNIKKRNK